MEITDPEILHVYTLHSGVPTKEHRPQPSIRYASTSGFILFSFIHVDVKVALIHSDQISLFRCKAQSANTGPMASGK